MAKDYDKALTRLIGILTKLSNNEQPTSIELALEYGVSQRTIQNDIAKNLMYYPIRKTTGHRYMFEDGYNLKQTVLSNDEIIFLNLALSQFNDVEDIDKVKDSIYKKIISKNFYSPYFIKQDDLEDIDIDSPFISKLEALIKDQEIAQIEFTRTTKELELYKIAAFDGFWYLFAKDLSDGKTKTFKLSHIKKIKPQARYYKTPKEHIEGILEKVHSAFFDEGNTFRVLIEVEAEVAQYFAHKEFLSSQIIEKKNEDGSLIISFEVTHDEDIDNIIKAWLPHVQVLEPVRYRNKLLLELKTYIQKVETK